MDVLAMMFIVRIITNAVVVRSWLPYLAWKICFFAAAVRKPAFNKLNRAFHRNPGIWRQNEMRVVRHNYKFVEEKFALCAICKHRV